MVHNIEGEAGRMTVRTLACVCKLTFFFFFLMKPDLLSCVIHHWNGNVWWWVCGRTPQLTGHLLSLATLWRTNRESRTAAESFKIEINPLARHKWEDNIIITPQVSCFCFSICLLSFHQAVAIWCIVYVYVYVRVSMFWCACTHEREQV